MKLILACITMMWATQCFGGLTESENAAKALLSEYHQCGLAAVARYNSGDMTVTEVADVAVASCDSIYGQLEAAIRNYLGEASNGNRKLAERVRIESAARAQSFKSRLRSVCIVAAAEGRISNSVP